MDKYFKNRMEGAMKDAADIQRELYEKRGVELPPGVVGEMGLSLFQSRMWLAMMNNDEYPDDPSDMFR